MVEIFSPFISLVSSKIADNKLNEVPIFFFFSRFVSICKNVGSKDVGTNILTPPPYVRDSVGLVCTKCTLSTGKQTNPWFITLAPRKYTSDNISFEVVVRGEARFSKRKGVSFSFLSLCLFLSFSRLLDFLLLFPYRAYLFLFSLDRAMTYRMEREERSLDCSIEFTIIVK